MPLTITVKDPLAVELQTEANSRRMSVEQFALEVLGRAVQRQGSPPANQRRLALIRKQFAGGLTSEEAAELQSLQRDADRYLESLDSEMLSDVANMEKAASDVIDGSPR